MARTHATSPAALTALLVGIGLFNSLLSDLYIPALRMLAGDLGTTPLQAQQTISLFFLACAFMSLWHGALADAYGRKPTVLAALAVLCLSSLACVAAARIEHLLLLRTLQGLAAGAGIVISRAIVLDLHQGLPAQRMLSRITLVQTVAPVLMPIVGGWLTLAFGWRAVFAFIAVVAAAMGATVWRWLPETLPPARRRPLHPVSLWHAYREVAGSPSFLRLAVAHVANWVSLILYVVAAPAFVIGLLGRDESAFWLVYLPLMSGMVGGFLLFPRIVRRASAYAPLRLAYAILGLGVALNLILSGSLPPGLHNLVPLLVLAFGVALAMPGLVGMALDPFGERAGVASSCHSFLQFAATAAVAGLLAPLLWGSMGTLALGSACLTATGAIALWRERSARRSAMPRG